MAEMDRHIPVHQVPAQRHPNGIIRARAAVARELHECCQETGKPTRALARLPHSEAHQSCRAGIIDRQGQQKAPSTLAVAVGDVTPSVDCKKNEKTHSAPRRKFSTANITPHHAS